MMHNFALNKARSYGKPLSFLQSLHMSAIVCVSVLLLYLETRYSLLMQNKVIRSPKPMNLAITGHILIFKIKPRPRIKWVSSPHRSLIFALIFSKISSFNEISPYSMHSNISFLLLCLDRPAMSAQPEAMFVATQFSINCRVAHFIIIQT